MHPPVVLILLSGVAVVSFGAGCTRSDDAAPAPSGDVTKSEPPVAAAYEDVTASCGIEFSIDRAVDTSYYMPESMGTGLALVDIDGDDDLDVYLVNGFRSASGALVTPEGANRLWRNDGDWSFTDVTDTSGAGDTGYGMGVATGDVNNDGHVDLFITNVGRDRLLLNHGDGTFLTSLGAGIDEDRWSSSAGFFDCDADGDLDLWVVTYLDIRRAGPAFDAAGRPEYPSPAAYPGVADLLYRNEGDGTFVEIGAAGEIGGTPGRGLGVIFRDLDGDGNVDVYVANDGEPNFAWIGDGRGGFEERGLETGLAVNRVGLPEASMGITAGDVDGDGTDEIFATHLVAESNTIWKQIAPGRYEDATLASGLGARSLDLTGFGALFFDHDLDGDLDLAVVNGRVLRRPPHRGADAIAPHWQPYAEPNQLYLNDGGGRFASAEAEGAPFTTTVEVSRGLAAGDLDGDGDLDLAVANGNGTIRVFRNRAAHDGHWLHVRAIDPARQRDAFGAVITIEAGDRRWTRYVTPVASYLSSLDGAVHLGLGSATSYDAAEVTWPDGVRERFGGGQADRRVTLSRGGGRAVEENTP